MISIFKNRFIIVCSVYLCVFAFLLYGVTRTTAQIVAENITVTINETETIFCNENYEPGVCSFVVFLDRNLEDVPQLAVECDLDRNYSGYSQATFTEVNVSPGEYGTVEFSPDEAGRINELRCWASNAASNITKESSMSDPHPLQVRSNGTVSICEDQVVKLLGPTIQQTFEVVLNQPVEKGYVRVSCSGNGDLDLDFTEINITLGNTEANVKYTLVSWPNPSTAATSVVQCDAETIGSTVPQFVLGYSQGKDATFTIMDRDADLVPESTHLFSTQMKVFMTLREPMISSEVNFWCQTGKGKTEEEAKDQIDFECDYEAAQGTDSPIDNTTATTPAETTVPVVPSTTTPLSSSEPPGGGDNGPPETPMNLTDWIVVPDRLKFIQDDSYKSMSLSRQSQATHKATEFVYVYCCSLSVDDPVYGSTNASMTAVAYLEPGRPINWTVATPQEELEKETEVTNPAYIEVSPCPCDMIFGVCDIGCCCDSDCTSDDQQLFECTPGIDGGYGEDETPRHRCAADYFKRPPWHPLMCVETENSGHLGSFWFPEPALQSKDDYTEKLTDADDEFSYSPDLPDKTSTAYVEGASVRTTLDGVGGHNYRLTLPQHTWSGQCLWNAPVSYLQDTEATCILIMAEDVCTYDSKLSALIYAQSTAWMDPPCVGTIVLEEGGGDHPTVTDVHYHCADSDYLKRHVRSLKTYDDVVSNSNSSFFSLDDENFDKDNCSFDGDTGMYTCDHTQFVADDLSDDLPPRCDFDNGLNKPPPPEMDGDMCNNAVINIIYNFTWQGQGILLMNATVILADIPLEQTEGAINAPTDVVQTFISLFTHSSQKSGQSDNDEESNATLPIGSGSYKRSGNPGYEIDLPVISGMHIVPEPEENDTTVDPGYIDVNQSRRLSLWKPGPDSLCLDAERRTITFGSDAMSSCFLRLGLQDLEDCDKLRKLVLSYQDMMMPSTYISRGGDPDRLDIQGDWIPILRENLTDTIENVTLPENVTTEAMTTEETTEPPSGTTAAQDGTTITAEDTTPEEIFVMGPDYLANLPGRCPDIPSGVHVDILYADSGLANDAPIRTIVGAKISYTLSLWELRCVSGMKSAPCNALDDDENSSLVGAQTVQSFIVSSSVNFIKVPATPPEPQTRYEKDHERPVPYCSQDACWPEFFYPWLWSFKGDDHGYVIGFTLVWVIFLIGFFMITRPWW